MAIWTAADVKIFAPEFCDVAVPVIDRVISLIAGQIAPDCWLNADNARLAGVNLTAHYLLMSGQAEAVRARQAADANGGVPPAPAQGLVSGVTVGSVSTQYGSRTEGGTVNPSRSGSAAAIYNGADAALAATVYGLEFLRLRRENSLGAMLV